jgi:cytochrome c oxidase subunit IV
MLMLAVLQASIAVTYFMHLGKERTVLFLALIPYTLFVLFMMNMIWSDSFRLLHLRPH